MSLSPQESAENEFLWFFSSYPSWLPWNVRVFFAKPEALFWREGTKFSEGNQRFFAGFSLICLKNQRPTWHQWMSPSKHLPVFPGHLGRRKSPLSTRVLPMFEDMCFLASGIQWTVLCLRARSLGRGWGHQMWCNVSQWHWRELVITQWTGSSSTGWDDGGGMGYMWGCECGPGLESLWGCFST